MSPRPMDTRHSVAPEPRPSEVPLRRPYEAPCVLFREPLEALAAVCQPSPPAKGSRAMCPTGPVSS